MGPADDRPWSDLSQEEQDALIAECGRGHVTQVEVEDVPAEQWGVWEDFGHHDPDDDHREGVDALQGGAGGGR